MNEETEIRVRNSEHPECQPDEVLLMNIKMNNWDDIRWETKRLGTVAYRLDGRVAKGLFPVFIKKEENPERALRILQKYKESEKDLFE